MQNLVETNHLKESTAGWTDMIPVNLEIGGF